LRICLFSRKGKKNLKYLNKNFNFMTLRDWWKFKKYWVKGGIIGFCVSIILTTLWAFSVIPRIKCSDLGCKDYFTISAVSFVFYAPICILIGIIIGFIIDKIKSKKNK